MKTVVGLYDNFEKAKDAVQDLIDNGFSRDNISLIASDEKGEYKRYLDERERMGDQSEDIAEDTLEGAGIGAVIGGLGALALSLAAITIPGLGPILAAGPLAAALAGAGVGAAAGGVIGALTNLGVPEEQAEKYMEGVRHGNVLVTLETTDNRASQAVNILNRHNPIDIDRSSEEWRRTEGRVESRPDMDREQEATIPIIEEEMKVGKREVDRGTVDIRTRMEEEEVEETINLREEEIHVERRDVDRPASEKDFETFKEGTFEVTETDEEAVVDKEARVTGEVDIEKRVTERPETVRGTVRHTEVDITQDLDEYDNMFRDHFQTSYSAMGTTYDEYQPAYRYGYELAYDDRYMDRDWNMVQMEARRDWERRHPNMVWDDVKDAIHHGWMTAKRKL